LNQTRSWTGQARSLANHTKGIFSSFWWAVVGQRAHFGSFFSFWYAVGSGSSCLVMGGRFLYNGMVFGSSSPLCSVTSTCRQNNNQVLHTRTLNSTLYPLLYYPQPSMTHYPLPSTLYPLLYYPLPSMTHYPLPSTLYPLPSITHYPSPFALYPLSPTLYPRL
jgi:hypothetical protein